MKKLTLLGIALSAALLATPFSLHWTPAKTLALSLDTAEARIGRPLTPGALPALIGKSIGAHIDADMVTMARQQ